MGKELLCTRQGVSQVVVRDDGRLVGRTVKVNEGFWVVMLAAGLTS